MRLKIAKMKPKMVKMRAKMFKMRPKMAKMRPKMAKMRPKMTKMRPKMGKMRPKMGKMRPKMGMITPIEKTLKKHARKCVCMHAFAFVATTIEVTAGRRQDDDVNGEGSPERPSSRVLRSKKPENPKTVA